jgi:hypothetical protein
MPPFKRQRVLARSAFAAADRVEACRPYFDLRPRRSGRCRTAHRTRGHPVPSFAPKATSPQSALGLTDLVIVKQSTFHIMVGSAGIHKRPGRLPERPTLSVEVEVV